MRILQDIIIYITTNRGHSKLLFRLDYKLRKETKSMHKVTHDYSSSNLTVPWRSVLIAFIIVVIIEIRS